ncbi:hypothetical protein CSIM01_08527 [Colletotrichum simmondsii]|uniref:Uncharacterized protein n=1 Tax=Colletotrichum simmondsii TaxID=703756 RepID=A0A135SY20_9PEZI|nr:hypothetical protein CSIM01_08527 [Colletotrichum simmondsii]
MATPGSLYPPPTTPTSDFAYVITNCAKAKVKWEVEKCFIWHGDWASCVPDEEDEEIIGDLQSEDGHGHLPLKFPGPLPDHFGASVVCYSRQNPDGFKYEVINSAVNDPKQSIAFAIRLVVGNHPQALPMTGNELCIFLQMTGFFNPTYRYQAVEKYLASNEGYVADRSKHIFCNNAAVSEDDEEIRIVKFVVGRADPLIDSMSFFLPLWLEAHRFHDVLRRNLDIERKKARFRKEFAFETERIARTSAYLMQVKKRALQ